MRPLGMRPPVVEPGSRTLHSNSALGRWRLGAHGAHGEVGRLRGWAPQNSHRRIRASMDKPERLPAGPQPPLSLVHEGYVVLVLAGAAVVVVFGRDFGEPRQGESAADGEEEAEYADDAVAGAGAVAEQGEAD